MAKVVVNLPVSMLEHLFGDRLFTNTGMIASRDPDGHETHPVPSNE